ncbi:MAG: hypothetical protein ACUVXJ_06080 [Phycisphaerae bacterium]
MEQVYDDAPEPYKHQAELITNTLTGRGLSILDLSIAPDSYDFQYIDAGLFDLQAELTETGYSKVFAQGDSYFQFWVQPRDKNYEFVVRVEQQYDDGLVPAYLAGGDRAFDLFAVLEGVGSTTPGEAGFWYFIGTLAPGVDYHWYGGVRAAAESNGLLSGPFNARLRMDLILVPEQMTISGSDRTADCLPKARSGIHQAHPGKTAGRFSTRPAAATGRSFSTTTTGQAGSW